MLFKEYYHSDKSEEAMAREEKHVGVYHTPFQLLLSRD